MVIPKRPQRKKGGKQMIIWAIINRRTYNELKNGSTVFCMIEDSPWGKTEGSITGYQFVAKYMERKSGKFAPTIGAVPFLGWVHFPGEDPHPDPKDDFLYKSDMVYVKLDVPEKEVLLSNALVWDAIMYGEYYPVSNDLDTLDAELENFQKLDLFAKTLQIKQSWARAFQVDSDTEFVLGCFWTIEPEMLVK